MESTFQNRSIPYQLCKRRATWTMCLRWFKHIIYRHICYFPWSNLRYFSDSCFHLWSLTVPFNINFEERPWRYSVRKLAFEICLPCNTSPTLSLPCCFFGTAVLAFVPNNNCLRVYLSCCCPGNQMSVSLVLCEISKPACFCSQWKCAMGVWHAAICSTVTCPFY